MIHTLILQESIIPVSELQQEQLEWATKALKDKATRYDIYRDYYEGIQPVMIDHDRRRNIFGHLFGRLHMNLCSPVVDALVDRLQISSFSSDGGDEMQQAQDIWKRNRMARRAGQLHLESASAGDAYTVVWPNRLGEATFYPQKGHEVAVEYDTDEQGKIVRAAKYFTKADYFCMTLYYEDRIEKYEAPIKTKHMDRYTHVWPHPEEYSPRIDDGEAWPLLNDYGVIPVFHFANNADLGEYGQSELVDALDIQNMLNWFAFQTLIGVEYHALPQRYVTGMEIDVDPVTGQPIGEQLLSGYEKIWQIAAEASVGVLPNGDISALANLVNESATWMALVTQTPVHYFQMTANLVSGEAQKTAEQKLDAKVADRCTSFGDAWAKAMALAVRIDGGPAVDGQELDTNWKDTKPRNELEFWTNAQVKNMLGVSQAQVLREAGYTDAQIEQFKEEAAGEVPPEQAALQTAEGAIPAGDEFASSLQLAAQNAARGAANGAPG